MVNRKNAWQYCPDETKLLLVASTGGHLEQLHLWSLKWLKFKEREIHWVTFETPQSRSLLAGQDVSFIPYVAPRDWKAGLRSIIPMNQIVSASSPERVISTGAGVALAAFLAAAASRIPRTYIESLARVNTLSVTGRVVSGFPGVERYVQHPGLRRRGWTNAGSILDDFCPYSAIPRDSQGLRIFVTVGTIRPYGFDRLIRRLEQVLTPEDEVMWQIGTSSYLPSVGDVSVDMPRHELADKADWADVIISHAGVGSILSALKAGKVPVVVPRRAEFGEHVDNHQFDIAEFVSRRDLGVLVEADELTRHHLGRAAVSRCAPA